ncbi:MULTISPECIES: enolase C-terminal domain-like protein [Paraburkholderia]|uniref:enolase C-terminal domain-like protein n=1 Tax=Paraburkholderia TaxID=1822464 RepID=UPI0004770E02|nr:MULTISPECIES: enolase C-terminal domain-like protein [Paraburkholderia]
MSIVGISAIDGALWELLGKASGLPIYRLLGGHHQTVPAYHSGGLWLSSSADDLTREAQDSVGQGFQAMKMRLGSATFSEDAAWVRAVREAIRPKVKLMADANQGMTVPTVPSALVAWRNFSLRALKSRFQPTIWRVWRVSLQHWIRRLQAEKPNTPGMVSGRCSN